MSEIARLRVWLAERRRLVLLALLAVVVVAAAGPVTRMIRTYSDTQRCFSGGCADELPGRWSDGERSVTLDADGTFVARAPDRTMRGTWTATDRQICFVSAGDRTCMTYHHMGEVLMLDEAVYQRR